MSSGQSSACIFNASIFERPPDYVSTWTASNRMRLASHRNDFTRRRAGDPWIRPSTSRTWRLVYSEIMSYIFPTEHGQTRQSQEQQLRIQQDMHTNSNNCLKPEQEDRRRIYDNGKVLPVWTYQAFTRSSARHATHRLQISTRS